jgi:hypothetical protein
LASRNPGRCAVPGRRRRDPGRGRVPERAADRAPRADPAGNARRVTSPRSPCRRPRATRLPPARSSCRPRRNRSTLPPPALQPTHAAPPASARRRVPPRLPRPRGVAGHRRYAQPYWPGVDEGNEGDDANQVVRGARGGGGGVATGPLAPPTSASGGDRAGRSGLVIAGRRQPVGPAIGGRIARLHPCGIPLGRRCRLARHVRAGMGRRAHRRRQRGRRVALGARRRAGGGTGAAGAVCEGRHCAAGRRPLHDRPRRRRLDPGQGPRSSPSTTSSTP